MSGLGHPSYIKASYTPAKLTYLLQPVTATRDVTDGFQAPYLCTGHMSSESTIIYRDYPPVVRHYILMTPHGSAFAS